MKLTRIISGVAPALAIAAFIGFAAPVATYAQNAAPATTDAPAAARRPCGGCPRRFGEACASGDPGLRGSRGRHP